MTRAIKITKKIWKITDERLTENSTGDGERGGEKLDATRSLRPLQNQVRIQSGDWAHTGDTFPSHSLLEIELSPIIQTRSQWCPWENLPDLKVFSLRHVKFFPHHAQWSFLWDTHQQWPKNFRVFESVSFLVFIVLCHRLGNNIKYYHQFLFKK
jgi:hypothetical protein